MTPSRRPARHPLALTAALAAAALGLTACGGGTTTASSAPAPSTPATSTSPTPASSTASTPAPSSPSPTPSGTRSSAMPPGLDEAHVDAAYRVVLLAAGPGAEVARLPSSPLERRARLSTEAERIEELIATGASATPTRTPVIQRCVDTQRAALEAEAAVGAADVGLFAQPETAATTGGAPVTRSVPALTAAPKGKVTPLGVLVADYPDEAAARAAVDRARTAEEACLGVDLTGLGAVAVEDADWDAGAAFTVLHSPLASTYAHSLTVQDGERVVTVSQADAADAVPARADERARRVAQDVLDALASAD